MIIFVKMVRNKGVIVEACVAGVFVFIGVQLLTMLEETPFPKLGALLSAGRSDSVKFYAPPLAAVAVVAFNAKTLPNLVNVAKGLFLGSFSAFLVTNIMGPGKLTRCVACGAAMFSMKIMDAVFPPAGALAVMFVDNAKMQELGMFYSLMPGMTGTVVLLLLSYLRIQLFTALKPTFKQFDPKGELTHLLAGQSPRKS